MFMDHKNVVTAEYAIVTPMFLGGADIGKAVKKISPSSVKGALRFWWRALNWSRCLQQADSEEEALRKLHAEEGTLFGRESKLEGGEQVGGQGKFLLRVTSHALQLKTKEELNQDPALRPENMTGQAYLMGMGLMQYEKTEKKNIYTRGAIVSGSFTVELYFLGKADTKDVDAMKPVLKLFGLLGGLGSRNRKGLGSVKIVSLDGEAVADDRDSYSKQLKEIILPDSSLKLTNGLPPFTALSKLSKIAVSEEQGKTTPWELLGTLGSTMQKFRGWGYRRKDGQHYLGSNTLANHNSFSAKQNDHQKIYDIAREKTGAALPSSVVFGLPRTYNLSRAGNVTLTPANSSSDQEDKRSRRASPLFLHIHETGEQAPFAVQLFLPALFLPEKDHIVPTIEKRDSQPLTPQKPTDWTVIGQYLDLDEFKDWEVVL